MASGIYPLPLSLRKHMYPPVHLQQNIQSFIDRINTGITFLGSGNYHYLSYFLIKKIKEPFSLILIDHHSDAITSDFLHCGNWVAKALESNPLLISVLMIGVHDRYPNLLKSQSFSDKIIYIPTSELNCSLLPKLNALTPTLPLYISIDKDALKDESAKTDWDHGCMTLAQLSDILHTLRKHTIVGVDICGELPVPKNKEACQLNQTANLVILEALQAKNNVVPLHPTNTDDDGFFPEKSA
ncbi:arginase family protein [Cytophagaceae bacterium ABcell3]|nr:arginase family protein [Cytophagaceae bacterium ABcell3]